MYFGTFMSKIGILTTVWKNNAEVLVSPNQSVIKRQPACITMAALYLSNQTVTCETNYIRWSTFIISANCFTSELVSYESSLDVWLDTVKDLPCSLQ